MIDHGRAKSFQGWICKSKHGTKYNNATLLHSVNDLIELKLIIFHRSRLGLAHIHLPRAHTCFVYLSILSIKHKHLHIGLQI